MIAGLHLLPEHLRGEMARWITHGVMPGAFLQAALSNDLARAVFAADVRSLARLPELAKFLQEYAPRACWGSPAAVVSWSRIGGLTGLRREYGAGSHLERPQSEHIPRAPFTVADWETDGESCE